MPQDFPLRHSLPPARTLAGLAAVGRRAGCDRRHLVHHPRRAAGQGRPRGLRRLPPDPHPLAFLWRPQLPLCARCSGQFLGALAGLVAAVALGRGKAARLPPRAVTIVLLGFIAAWALDGFNSYLTLFPGAPHLYEPHNILRTTTGAMQGVALISLVLPFFNVTLWARTTDGRPSSWRELLLLCLIALIVAAVGSEMGAAALPPGAAQRRRHADDADHGQDHAGRCPYAERPRLALARRAAAAGGRPGAWQLEILAINLFRAWLTAELGLPFERTLHLKKEPLILQSDLLK